MKRTSAVWPVLRLPLTLAVFALALALTLSALSNVSGGSRDEGRRQLEESLRRAAVTCYAGEGVYPPTLAYLEEHYGVQVDRDRYSVDYSAFAQNLMPEITVLENEG